MTDKSFINNDLKYNDLHTYFFYRTLKDANSTKKDAGMLTHSPEDIITKIPYYLNKHGYRSEEFNKNNEVLILGCSQTYGSGMPDQFTWPIIFAENLKKTYSRIACPGDSVVGQVYKAFKYFEEFGNPKTVLALLPLYRMEYTKVKDKFISHGGNNDRSNTDSLGVAYFHNSELLKFSKAPHDPSYVIPKQFVIFYNFMFIKILEQYCESHNIKFIWSFYDEGNEIKEFLNEKLKNVLKNFLPTSDMIKSFQYLNKSPSSFDDYNILMKSVHEKCHLEFKEHLLYNWASDYNVQKKLGHWGIHMHQHVADEFIKKYKEIEND